MIMYYYDYVLYLKQKNEKTHLILYIGLHYYSVNMHRVQNDSDCTLGRTRT